VFSDFYVAALCNLGFTICGSYIEQVWPTLVYNLFHRKGKIFQKQFCNRYHTHCEK